MPIYAPSVIRVVAVSAAICGAVGKGQLARFPLAELQALAPATETRLRRVLRAEGALLVTEIPGFAEIAGGALDSLGECFRHFDTLEKAGGDGPVHSQALADNGVERLTMAARSSAGAPSELPAWAQEACPHLKKRTAQLRSFVGLLLMHFAHSADATASAQERQESLPPGSLEDLVRRGTLLEHFHRYRPRGTVSKRPMDLHTDAGLVQALAVRWCQARDEAGGLELELPSGSVVPIEADLASSCQAGSEEAGGLLLLLGQAAQEWLPQLRLRAAPHAVAPWSSGAERLVYGVMALPPEDWHVAENVSFGMWWKRAQMAVQQPDSFGEESAAGQGCLSTQVLQRRLQDQARSCPSGSIYCWMQCQTVPTSLTCQAEHAICLSDTTGKVCPEDGSHDASCKPGCPTGGDTAVQVLGAGEAEVVGAYRANGWAGGKRKYMKPSAFGPQRAHIVWDDYWKSETFGQWVLFVDGYKNGAPLYYADSDTESPPKSGWQMASGTAPRPHLDFPSGGGGGGPSGGALDFCNGVLTDMHMLGFTSAGQDNPCLIFLFSGWELTDSAKFWGAAVVSVLAGIFAEWLVAARRWESKWRPASRIAGGRFSPEKISRHSFALFLYALTRSVGYLVMLVTMTYSTELFLAIILGLTIGHGCFNMTAPPGEDMTPCCQAGGLVDARRVELEESGVRATFHVTGMTCGACRSTVQRSVEALDCVMAVTDISVATGKMEVALNKEADVLAAERAISGAVEDVGFSVELLSPTAGACCAEAADNIPGTAAVA